MVGHWTHPPQTAAVSGAKEQGPATASGISGPGRGGDPRVDNFLHASAGQVEYMGPHCCFCLCFTFVFSRLQQKSRVFARIVKGCGFKWPWVITYADPILGRNTHVPPILMFTRAGFSASAKYVDQGHRSPPGEKICLAEPMRKAPEECPSTRWNG